MQEMKDDKTMKRHFVLHRVNNNYDNNNSKTKQYVSQLILNNIQDILHLLIYLKSFTNVPVRLQVSALLSSEQKAVSRDNE